MKTRSKGRSDEEAVESEVKIEDVNDTREGFLTPKNDDTATSDTNTDIISLMFQILEMIGKMNDKFDSYAARNTSELEKHRTATTEDHENGNGGLKELDSEVLSLTARTDLLDDRFEEKTTDKLIDKETWNTVDELDDSMHEVNAPIELGRDTLSMVDIRREMLEERVEALEKHCGANTGFTPRNMEDYVHSSEIEHLYEMSRDTYAPKADLVQMNLVQMMNVQMKMMTLIEGQNRQIGDLKRSVAELTAQPRLTDTSRGFVPDRAARRGVVPDCGIEAPPTRDPAGGVEISEHALCGEHHTERPSWGRLSSRSTGETVVEPTRREITYSAFKKRAKANLRDLSAVARKCAETTRREIPVTLDSYIFQGREIQHESSDETASGAIPTQMDRYIPPDRGKSDSGMKTNNWMRRIQSNGTDSSQMWMRTRRYVVNSVEELLDPGSPRQQIPRKVQRQNPR